MPQIMTMRPMARTPPRPVGLAVASVVPVVVSDMDPSLFVNVPVTCAHHHESVRAEPPLIRVASVSRCLDGSAKLLRVEGNRLNFSLVVLVRATVAPSTRVPDQ